MDQLFLVLNHAQMATTDTKIPDNVPYVNQQPVCPIPESQPVPLVPPEISYTTENVSQYAQPEPTHTKELVKPVTLHANVAPLVKFFQVP